MPETDISIERKPNSLIIRLNRPARANALTLDMANQLFKILKATTTDRSVRAVLLTGAEGHFMDGLDLGIFAPDFNAGIERNNQIILPYHSAIRELHVMDKPVICAVAGKVSGPGLSLMLACDLVVAAEETMFNCGFTSYAMPPDGACSYFLPRKIGAAKAIELMMLSKDFSAQEAHAFGLVNRLVPAAALQTHALAWLEELAAGPTKAFAAVRKLAIASFEQDIVKHLGLEHNFHGGCARSFDFREAMKSLNAGKPPFYSGN